LVLLAALVLLTARLSGHQVMINGHALSLPLSFAAAIPVGLKARFRRSVRSEARTSKLDGHGHLMRPPRSRTVASAELRPRLIRRSGRRPGRRPGRPGRARMGWSAWRVHSGLLASSA